MWIGCSNPPQRPTRLRSAICRTHRAAAAGFIHNGHILTCTPTGAGKGIGAVIPNLLDCPGSVFVLDLKGENYAVTARDLLRGFLIHVAGLPAEHRTMAELRAILTAPEDQFAEILADMLAAAERGG